MELSAKDLMIGDYLMWNGLPYRVIQVTGIVSDSFTLENRIDDEGEPIRLTPEILTKNGFLHGSSYIFSQNREGGGLTMAITFYEKPVFGVKVLTQINTQCSNKSGVNSIHSCDIEYVHELQHAMRLVGIKKELKL